MVASLATPATSRSSPLHKVTELCDYRQSHKTVLVDVQHELSPQDNAA